MYKYRYDSQESLTFRKYFMQKGFQWKHMDPTISRAFCRFEFLQHKFNSVMVPLISIQLFDQMTNIIIQFLCLKSNFH